MSKRILITGDVHGEIEIMNRFSGKNFPYGKDLTKDDIIIVAGDFGLIWSNEPSKSEKYYLKWLQDRPWTTCFIDGNHENHPRLLDLPTEKKWDGTVGVVRDGIYHLRRGEIYNIYGNSIFCMGGALSWDKARRKEFLSWWSEEVPNHTEMEHALINLEKHNWTVDFIITHTVPKTITKIVGLKGDKKDATCDFLEHISQTIKSYKAWYAGHMHIDKDIGRFRILYYDIVDLTTREKVKSIRRNS